MEWKATDNTKTRRAALKTVEGQKSFLAEMDRRAGEYFKRSADLFWSGPALASVRIDVGKHAQPSTSTDVTPA